MGIEFGVKEQESKDVIEPWRVELRIDDIKRYADSALSDYRSKKHRVALSHLLAIRATVNMLIEDFEKLHGIW